MKSIHLAVIGATGMVGRTTLAVLEEWKIPVKSLRLFASSGSGGTTVPFRGELCTVETLDGIPAGVDAAIFATSKRLSAEWVPKFREAGIFVIDHSSRFRMDDDVPLIIPEINGDKITAHNNLISNPNCSASIVLLPLAALHRAFDLKAVIVSTYQSVTGSGQQALEELNEQVQNPGHKPEVYPRPIAFNVIPQIGDFDKEGRCVEEQKVIEEVRKILDLPGLPVYATTVRVPVRVGHSASVTVQCGRSVSFEDAAAAFYAMPGMRFEPDTYKTPLETAGQYDVFVSRLRVNAEHPEWLEFWVVGDNLLKGAASNAVQILREVYS